MSTISWHNRHSNGGATIWHGDGLRLLRPASAGRSYVNAQIDDFAAHAQALRWRAPLRLSLEARFSHTATELRGTAGFGLWNYPWAGRVRWPQAAWFFFGAAPHDMALAEGIPGHGWKAATVDLGQALRWAPLAPVVVPLLNVGWFKRRIWPRIQRAAAIAEASLTVPMSDWHRYMLEWREDGVAFWVDQRCVLRAPAPRGPLSFVAWIDNQYAIVRPEGRFGWGLVESPPQWLELRGMELG